jgi:uncharacterized protein
MDALLVQKLPEVIKLCNAFGVNRLYVFGSAASGTRTVSSDFDFAVTYPLQSEKFRGLRFFDFQIALEDLLGAKVDVLAEAALKNPYLKESYEATKVMLYEQECSLVFE